MVYTWHQYNIANYTSIKIKLKKKKNSGKMTHNSKTLPWQNENKTKNAPPTKHVSQTWEACAHKAMCPRSCLSLSGP